MTITRGVARRTIVLRFDEDALAQAREAAELEEMSVNDFVAMALRHELERYEKSLAALKRLKERESKKRG